MTSLQDRTNHDNRYVSPVDDDASRGDWLGLAGYLAEAISYGDVTVEGARTELAAEVTGVAEHRALGQAVEFAAIQFGIESLTTTLLASVYRHVTPTADVA
jgi:hypothetical protein